MPKAWDTFEWDDEPMGLLGFFTGHRLGLETQKEEKMKKQFGKLSKREREKTEAQYHRLSPQHFDDRMSRAKHQSPGAIRLPSRLVQNLKTLAESEGEPEYQTMVKRWIEERLQQETSTPS